MKLIKKFLILSLTLSLVASCGKKEEEEEEEDDDVKTVSSFEVNLICQAPASDCADESANTKMATVILINTSCDEFTGEASQMVSSAQASMICADGVCNSYVDNASWESEIESSEDIEAMFVMIDTDEDGNPEGPTVGEPRKCQNFGEFPLEENGDEYVAEFTVDEDAE